LIGEDVDGDGIGEPVLHHKKPIQGHPIAAPPTSDEFDSPKLGPQWEWNHNPRDTHWSLTEQPGRLRLRASVPVGNGDFWGACNTISQRIMGNTWGVALARFDLSGMKPGQQGGFARFGGPYHLLGVRIQENGSKELFFCANGELKTGPQIEGNDLWVRTVNEGDQARFAYSTDGQTYTDFGNVFTIKFGKWTGDRLGFFCWNDKQETGYLDIDWFHYDYDGPKAGN
jgi:beta-xylosidase